MITIFVKTWRDHSKTLFAWSLTLVAMASIQMSIYPSISKNAGAMQQFLDSYPDAIKKIFRMQDYTSGPGFLGTELFSLMIPLVLIAVGGTWGASATAEEEDDGTAELLFTLPITRRKILLGKMLAAISVNIFLGMLVTVNILLLRNSVEMKIDARNLWSATTHSISLGILFTGVAFFIGALNRHKGVAVGVVTGIALVLFLIYSLSSLVDSFDAIEPFNPMEWALASTPLFQGVDILDIAKLNGIAIVFYLAALITFDRKDISAP